MSLPRGDLLPTVSLPSAPAGAMVGLRSGRGPRVLVMVHSAGCEECGRYVRGDLASSADRVAEWGGRLAVVVPGRMEGAIELAKTIPGTMQVLGDPKETVASGSAAVVIADEWGEVYFQADAGADHHFPAAAEIGEWVRFIAIQCPECEGPEGEWKTVW